MISRLSRPAALCALSGLLTLAAGTARADVTVVNTIAVEGIGAMAFGNLKGTTRTTISGDKSRMDSDIQMQSRLVRLLAHNAVGPSATIVRLGDDRIYHLNINKKEYTETTFEQMREQMNKLADQMNQAGQKEKEEQQGPSAVDESKCEWLPPRLDVKKTGEKAQIAGYDAERLTLLASQPCKDKETGAICEITLALDEWLASGFTENSEAQKYHKAYAAKLGFDVSSSQDFSQRAQAMFGRYKGIWSELVSKMQGMKGYPVKSSFTLALGGEQCKNAQQAKSSEESSGNSSGGGGGTANLAGQVAGKLGSLFHKKKDDEQAAQPAQPAQPADAPPVPAGDVVMMTVSTQLVSVTTDVATPNAFEVPADFKKRELKTQ
ncbi:MAG TPA: hypothetical protein VFB37_01080 [Steroidobacteraceae bacterium]|nr:hypothetical protein [Steroidobacteraceae bacterium]